MKEYPAGKIRNLALLGHGGSGKTTFAEAVLFDAKATDRFGRVADGNTVLDFDAEEIRRKFSINTAIAAVEWNDAKLNLLDTPGYFDFVGEVYQGLRVADAGIVLVPAKDGVAVGTEKSVKYLRDRNLPVVFFVSKMDEENADFARTLGQIAAAFGAQAKPFALPVLEGGKMKGYVDVLSQKAYMNGANGATTETAVPAGMAADAAAALEALKEHAAESDESLMEKFFAGEDFTPEEMLKGLALSVAAGSVYPVFCGAAASNWAVKGTVDRLVALLPAADAAATVPAKKLDGTDASVKCAATEPLAAIVFKTIADPFVGRISMFRVYAGVLKANSTVYNPGHEKDERIGSLFLMVGKKQLPTDQVSAGDIGAVTKLVYTGTNDTLCDKAKPVLLPRTEFPVPCLSMAVEGKAKGDEEKIGAGLHKLQDEDPVFTMGYNGETHQLLLSGIGEQHLDVLMSKLKSKFNAEGTLVEPRVPYRETIRKKVRVEGKHKKQSGGHGQFGHVWVEFEPGQGEGLTFEEHIFGGSVPKQYHPGVEKGLQDAIKKVDKFATSANKLVEDPELLSNLRSISANFDTALQSLTATLNGFPGLVERESTRWREEFTPMLAAIHGASAEFEKLAADLRAGKGTIGRLVQDPVMHESLVELVRHFDETLRELSRMIETMRSEGISLQ